MNNEISPRAPSKSTFISIVATRLSDGTFQHSFYGRVDIQAWYLIWNSPYTNASRKLFSYKSWRDLNLFFNAPKEMDSSHKARKFSSTPYRYKRTSFLRWIDGFTSPPRRFMYPHTVWCRTAYRCWHLIWSSCPNIKSYHGTQNLCQYWRTQKKRRICIHWMTISTIRTEPIMRTWTTMQLMTLFESHGKLCCNPTPSTVSSLRQHRASTPHWTKSYRLKSLQYAHSSQNHGQPVRSSILHPCFSDHVARVQKRMIIANTLASSNIIRAIAVTSQNCFPIRIREVDINPSN